MRDLIEKQTASLAQRGGEMALYSPEKLKGVESSSQEVLDAESSGSSEAILKDILKTLEKSYMLVDNIDVNVAEMASAMRELVDMSMASMSPANSTVEKTSSESPMLALSYDEPTKPSLQRAKNDDAIDVEYRSIEKTTPMIAAPTTGGDEGLQAEAAAESSEKVDRQIQLLEIIAGALTGKPERKEDGKKKEETKEDSSDSGLGIKGLMKGLLKGFALTAIIGALANGLVDGFKEFSESGDIGKALVAGLGGVLDFLTFGLLNKESVQYVIDNFSKLVEEYIVAPIASFVDSIGNAFDEYISQPIMQFVNTISDVFNTYIAEPIMAFAEWYFNTVKSIVMDFVVNPITAFVTGLAEAFETYIKKPFESMLEFAKKLNPFSSDEGQKKPAGEKPTPIFDEMGNVTGYETSATKPIEPAAASSPAGKATAARIMPIPADNTNAALTMGAFNTLPDTAVALSPATSIAKSTQVYDTSANNVAAKESAQQASTAPIIVNAPTNVSNNKQNISIPSPIRNQDVGFSAYRNKVM